MKWRIDEYVTPQGKGYYTNIDTHPLRDDEAALKFRAHDPNRPGMYNTVKRLGKNGGWICAPTHHVQLDTPVENFFNLLKIMGIEDKRALK